ncbi:MAG: glycogen synthase [Chloroflexota bacterium]
MNILLASAEVSPFAKAGGLADVASALPIEWQKYGQSPVVVMPKYRQIDVDKYGFKPTDIMLIVPMGYSTEFARLWYGYFPGTKTPVYLIEHNFFFDRKGIYGETDDYADNDRRFIFFSKAVFETAKALSFTPDIIHAHDFHTALTMPLLKSSYYMDWRFARTAGVYTIHNLAFQGWFDPDRAMSYMGLPRWDFYPGCWFERFGKFNAMKAGIMFADKITTVSPTYAKEIRMDYYSENMQAALNLRGADLIGILNGVYYDEWSPETDKLIYENYGFRSLDAKERNKKSFLFDHGLTEADNLDVPLVGMVTRLAEQKGIDLIIYKLEEYLATNQLRIALLGNGKPEYEDFFNLMKARYPKNALIKIGYDNTLAHRIIAASDFLLMPSRFEPCGLTQMYSLKYGTIPIVRLTGGLADTVFEYNPQTGDGTGFHFWQYNADDLAYAMRRGLSIYKQEPHWDIIRKNAMKQNFSSSHTALEYLKVFKWAIEKVRGGGA